MDFIFSYHNKMTKRQDSSHFNKKLRDVPGCELCKKPFSVYKMKVKHICKRCKRLVCSSCSNHKTFILGIDLEADKKHRTCDLCVEEIMKVDDFIAEKGLKWNSLSGIGKFWVNSMFFPFNFRRSPSPLTFKEAQSKFQKGFDTYEEDFRVIEKDVTKGRTDFMVFNYSVREFLCKIQLNIPSELSRKNIASVLTALMPLFPEIGYCQGMNFIVALLLCFLDEENCFLVMHNLLANILPPKFYNKTLKGLGLLGLSAEQEMLYKTIIIDFNTTFNRRNMMVQTFFQIYGPQFLLTLCSNIFNIETFYYLMDKVITEEKFAYIERAIMCIMVYVDKHTEEEDLNFLSQEITREINKKFLVTYMGNFEIDNSTRKDYYDDFLKQFASKWIRNSRSIIVQIENFTNFNQDEISKLQEKFQNVKSLGKKEFIEFMKNIYEDDELKQKALIHLSDEELGRLFEQFDDDKSGELDFREFLCCLSLMMRGSIGEKMEMIFKIFDEGKKGFLTASEANLFLDFCGKSFSSSDAFTISKEEAHCFVERWKKAFSNYEKITLIDVLEIQKDEIFETIESKYSAISRRGTANFMMESLEKMK